MAAPCSSRRSTPRRAAVALALLAWGCASASESLGTHVDTLRSLRHEAELRRVPRFSGARGRAECNQFVTRALARWVSEREATLAMMEDTLRGALERAPVESERNVARLELAELAASFVVDYYTALEGAVWPELEGDAQAAQAYWAERARTTDAAHKRAVELSEQCVKSEAPGPTLSRCRHVLARFLPFAAEHPPDLWQSYESERISSDFKPRASLQTTPCVFHGSVDGVLLPVHAQAKQGEPAGFLTYAHFLELGLEPKGVRLRVRSSWPLDGELYLDPESRPVALASKVELVPGSVGLARGSRVVAYRTDDPGEARIYRSAASDTGFDPKVLSKSLDCAHLALANVGAYDGLLDAGDGASDVHAGHAELGSLAQAGPLCDTADGRVVARVGKSGWEVWILEQREGWAKVRDRRGAGWGDEGFDFVGWVARDQLALGGAALSPLVTPKRSLSPTHITRIAIPLRTTPARSAAPVATVAADVPLVLALDRVGFVAAAVPGFLPPERGGFFWIAPEDFATLEAL